MKLQALVLSVALLFGAVAFAQSAPATPAAPAAKAPINILDRTQEPIGQAVAAEINAYFSSIDGVEVLKGLSAKDDTSRPEVRVMSKKLNDTESFVIVVITFHVQGKNLSTYVGTFAANLTADTAKDAADSASEAIGQALESIEGYFFEDYPNAFGPQQSTAAPSTRDNTVQI